ncbi:hypothetical protein P3T16_002636 [Paraburkholderia sp. GAS42]
MGYLFTRKRLYEGVWAGPITTLAKSVAISDVGLTQFALVSKPTKPASMSFTHN